MTTTKKTNLGAPETHPGVFITGTDTEVGKTWISLGVMAALQRAGIPTVAMKPVASGCLPTEEGLRNDDALRLIGQGSVPLPYDLVNPFAFAPAIAPHIAAREAQCPISLEKIHFCYRALTDRAGCCVVEGVGGWLVPLSATETAADLVGRLKLPVILVVGIRLGCINHALLSAESISRGGHELLGWVANRLQSGAERSEENIQALAKRINAPLLADIPCFPGEPDVGEIGRRMAPAVERIMAHRGKTEP